MSEQQRTDERIDELKATCDRLEKEYRAMHPGIGEDKVCVLCNEPIKLSIGLIDTESGPTHHACLHSKTWLDGAKAARDAKYWTPFRNETAAKICAGMWADHQLHGRFEENAKAAVAQADALIAALKLTHPKVD